MLLPNSDVETIASEQIQLACNFSRSFDITFCAGLLGSDSFVGDLAWRKKNYIVTSPTVDRLYGSRLKALLSRHKVSYDYHVIDSGETYKSLDTVADICRGADHFGISRQDAIIAVGGGVCSDLVGLAATLLRRGVDHLRIPTTLVGQIDAGIGIKSAVNYNGKKNLLGSFYPPVATYIDTTLLETLKMSHIRCGLSEMLKMALVSDRSLFEEISLHAETLLHSRFQRPKGVAQHIIRRSIELMIDVLQQNPFEEQPAKRTVDLGHTISPLLEAALNFTMTHGEAVAIDMTFSCLLSSELGLFDESEAERFVSLLTRIGLPVSSSILTVELCSKWLEHATKQRGGQLNLVVPLAIGQATFIESQSSIQINVLRRVLRRMSEMVDSRQQSSARLDETG